jgi:lysine 2,3-aminomutase
MFGFGNGNGNGGLCVLQRLLSEDGTRFERNPRAYLEILWEANSAVHALLMEASSLETARDGMYDYLARRERHILSLECEMPPLKQAGVREAVRVVYNIIAPAYEQAVGFSTLEPLWRLARGEELEVSCGFLMEFIYLFRALAGRANIYGEDDDTSDFFRLKGREAARRRMEVLDEIAEHMDRYLERYPSGLDQEVVERRRENRGRVLRALGATEAAWDDYEWHLSRVIKAPRILRDVLDLTPDEVAAVQTAVDNRIPFGITPYYLSLMDRTREARRDWAIRYQVIPPSDYVETLVAHRDERRAVFDFMGEADTSPEDLITRRYPRIAILKPYNTCSQICVYCQRNWEIDECMAPDAMAPEDQIERALAWFDEHRSVTEILVTGGDPMVMPDGAIRHLMDRLVSMPWIRRIRIGTRTPVVLPQRWTDETADLLAAYNKPGLREVCVVTHFEHPYEITPEARKAVTRIRQRGLGVYNQEVFSLFNSRRFESVKLRMVLRQIGVDPYYTFNMKGKEETESYIAPIARLLQERKEEARLLAGMDRTDEPVFNVPRLGKNHLRAWQDHKMIAVHPDSGRRVYSFHPWEKNLALVPPYRYSDVPIFSYLERLASIGEDIEDYRTIWYYY